MGANDVLQFLATTCGFPKEYNATELEVLFEFKKIAENVGFILGTLHAAAPKASIVMVGLYNPYPLVLPPPGADFSSAALNNALASATASVPGATFVPPCRSSTRRASRKDPKPKTSRRSAPTRQCARAANMNRRALKPTSTPRRASATK